MIHYNNNLTSKYNISSMSIHDLLKGLNEKGYIPRAFDIIGNKEKAVAIIEIPDSFKKKKMIAEAILRQHKNVKTVLEKKSPRKGVFRIRSYRILAGDKNTEVIHKESSCLFMLDPRKVYFSPREGTERERIANIIDSNENIMVFFAGIGAFPIVIAKKKRCSVTGIEINPKAVYYFRKNAEMNKVDVKIVKGDVKKVISKEYNEKFDRVIMPLPESSTNFLKEAIYCLKKGGTCHLYCFSKEDALKDVVKRIEENLEEQGRIELISIQKVLPWGPKIFKYRIDFRIL